MIWIGCDDMDRLLTYPDARYLSGCALPIQNMPVRRARVVPQYGGGVLKLLSRG